MEENPHISSPSSSGVDPSPYKYDVFISFRGGDARHNFTGHLYSALCRNQVKTYIDEISLEKGDDISRALSKAIEESAISIIIFSTNYGSSTWCLDELLHILNCKREKSQTILPIFLGVDPSDIRRQKNSYADAFVKHEQRFNNTMEKVQEWRQALIEAGGLSGWDSQVKSKHVIVDEVVGFVKEKLKHIRSNGGIEDLLKNLKEELPLVNRALEDAEEKLLTNQVVIKYEKFILTMTCAKSIHLDRDSCGVPLEKDSCGVSPERDFAGVLPKRDSAETPAGVSLRRKTPAGVFLRKKTLAGVSLRRNSVRVLPKRDFAETPTGVSLRRKTLEESLSDEDL